MRGRLAVDPEERKRVNPFEWERAFPGVFAQGGFDAVIGNPPWGAEFQIEEKQYLVNKFTSVPSKIKDSYFYFVYTAINNLRNQGKFSFILPNTWLLINNASEIRRELLEFEVEQIIDYGDGVFEQAIVASSIIVLTKNKNHEGKTRAIRYFKNELISDQLVEKSNWL